MSNAHSAPVPIRRALISVWDKTGVVEFARALAEGGTELISTGGTARALAEAGLKVRSIDELTGFPEMLDGRVKTLHPAVHAGLLARMGLPEHAAAMREQGLEPIDLVCINLYPFERTMEGGASFDEAIEMIDIGGPSMVRSAAKNAERVTVVTDPADYERVLAEVREHGGTTLTKRRKLQAKAFARTAAYDAAIATWIEAQQAGDASTPSTLRVIGVRVGELRYGENPHQPAAAYVDPGRAHAGVLGAAQLHGKALSYNNLLDADAALGAVALLARIVPDVAGAVVIKHTNPCGLATAPTLARATDAALAGDPLAAFGGIVAVNRTIDDTTAARLCEDSAFLEVLLAPGYAEDALKRLRERWKNLRILALDARAVEAEASSTLDVRSVAGGWLAQARDTEWPAPDTWSHAAGPTPAPKDLRAAAVLEAATARLSSNAIAIGGPTPDGAVALFGSGCGQVDRVSACHLAVRKAGDRARGAIAASDAFFPFPDGPEALIDAGVRLIVHPGGSRRDNETFALCEQRGVTCMTTGRRRFRH